MKLNITSVKAWLNTYLRAVYKGLRKIGSDNISILSSGMVYSTLLAVVPCLTFLSAFLTAFGGAQNFSSLLQKWALETFGESSGELVIEKVVQFSDNAMSLGIAGLISFIITGMLLAGKIDSVINNIFRTRPSDGLVKRYGKILIFLIVLTVVIALSLSLGSFVKEKAYTIMGLPFKLGAFSFIMNRWGRYIAVFVFFFFLLYFVPNVRIDLSSAVASSVLGTLTMMVFYFVFTRLITSTVKYSVIYGSMAAVLLVLLFFYIVWYIVILVADITYIYQFRPEGEEDEAFILSPEREIEEALTTIKEIAGSFDRGEGGISFKEIAKRSKLPLYRVEIYLKIFISSNFIKETSSSLYVPARPSNKIFSKDVISAVFTCNRESNNKTIRAFLNNGLESIKEISIGE